MNQQKASPQRLAFWFGDGAGAISSAKTKSDQTPINAVGGISNGGSSWGICQWQIFQGVISLRAEFPIAPLAVGFVQPLMELGEGELGMAAQ